MFQALIAFLTVMSGYVFVSTWHWTRYLLLRQPPQRIYFRAAFWGVWLFVLAFALVLHFRSSVLPQESVLAIWPETTSSLPWSSGIISEMLIASMILCLSLGLLGGYILNWAELVRRWPADWQSSLAATLEGGSSIPIALYSLTSRRPLKHAIEYLNADLERILLNALREEKPICLTMTDRKVYVGYLSGAIDPSDTNDMVRILPYMSGFRSKESLELVITDYYDQLYEKHQRSDSTGKGEEPEDNQPLATQSDFEVALPIRDIRSCRLFDTRLYLKYQRERRTAFAGFHDS